MEVFEKCVAAGVQPTHFLFNKVLDIYGKSTLHDAPEVGSSRSVIDRSPDTVPHHRIVAVPQRAEQLLKHMKIYNLKPNVGSYNAVLMAWGRFV